MDTKAQPIPTYWEKHATEDLGKTYREASSWNNSDRREYRGGI